MTCQFSKLMVAINGLMDFNHCTKTTPRALVNHCRTHYSLQIVLLIIMPHVQSWRDLPDVHTDSSHSSSTLLWCQPAAGVSLSQWIITSNKDKKYSKADKTTHLKSVFSTSWEIKIYKDRGFSARVLGPFQVEKERSFLCKPTDCNNTGN